MAVKIKSCGLGENQWQHAKRAMGKVVCAVQSAKAKVNEVEGRFLDLLSVAIAVVLVL